jgi:hypothetical protein
MLEKIFKGPLNALVEVSTRNAVSRYHYTKHPITFEKIYLEFSEIEETLRDKEEARASEIVPKKLTLIDRITELEIQVAILMSKFN